MPHREIPLHRERHILAKLALDWFREGYTLNHPNTDRQKFGAHADEMMTYMGLVVATTEGKPISISKLAQYVGLPRSTCERKVKELVELRVAKRDGKGYRLCRGYLRMPREQGKVRKLVQLVLNAADQFTKLGSLPIDEADSSSVNKTRT